MDHIGSSPRYFCLNELKAKGDRCDEEKIDRRYYQLANAYVPFLDEAKSA